MPEIERPFDRLFDRSRSPHNVWQAIWRGVKNLCPRCAQARLFERFLKPVSRCSGCAQNWTLHEADDFPPYISILITGHIMAPLMIALVLAGSLPTWAMMMIIFGVAIALLIGLLQPAKGAVIALQWWHGMHGFEKERA